MHFMTLIGTYILAVKLNLSKKERKKTDFIIVQRNYVTSRELIIFSGIAQC
jgi:hypothetical protein